MKSAGDSKVGALPCCVCYSFPLVFFFVHVLIFLRLAKGTLLTRVLLQVHDPCVQAYDGGWGTQGGSQGVSGGDRAGQGKVPSRPHQGNATATPFTCRIPFL